jgi:hypothetical protein
MVSVGLLVCAYQVNAYLDTRSIWLAMWLAIESLLKLGSRSHYRSIK